MQPSVDIPKTPWRVVMKVLGITFLLLFLSGSCFASSSPDFLKYILEERKSPPALAVVQQEKNGDNIVLDDPPDEYVAIVPYLLDYIHANVDDKLQGKNISGLVIVYSYPDTLEINILSDTRKKISQKIPPDSTLHDLGIRTAIVAAKVLEDGSDSNVFIGLQLFAEGLEYSGMDIQAEYSIQRGSWILVWTDLQITIHFILDISGNMQNIKKILEIITKSIFFERGFIYITQDGAIKIQVTNWNSVPNLRPIITGVKSSAEARRERGKPDIFDARKKSCRCVTHLPPPASPVKRNFQATLPCGEVFVRSGKESCAARGKELYPHCGRCFDVTPE